MNLGLWCCMLHCLTGPNPNTPGQPTMCIRFDTEYDGDVDLKDIAMFQNHPPITECWERLGDD